MLDRIRRWPSPAMAVALAALVVAMSGGAYAAKKIGARDMRIGAVTNTRLAKNAVSTSKLRTGSVIPTKLARGAVTTDKLPDAAVTAAKLAPGERAEGFVFKRPETLTLPGSADTVVATLNLPAGSFVVTAATSLGASGGGLTFMECALRDDGTVLTSASGSTTVAAFAESVALTGVSDGGAITLSCNPSANAVARNRTITAVRVGTVQSQ